MSNIFTSCLTPPLKTSIWILLRISKNLSSIVFLDSTLSAFSSKELFIGLILEVNSIRVEEKTRFNKF